MFLPSHPVLCRFGSLIYICCNFHGHSMCVFHHYSHVFVLCRVIWSPLFSCPLVLFSSFSFAMFPSFPFLLCLFGSLIYICCSFHGHSMRVFHHSHVFVPCRAIWSSLFSYPRPFSRLFLSQCSFPCLLFYVFLAHWSIFSVVSTGILCVSFITIATCLCPAGQSGVPFSLVLFPFLFLSFPNVPSPLLKTFYVFLAHWSIFAVVATGILCVSFTTIATCLCSCRVIWSPLFSCPPIFSRPFLLQSCLLFLFFYVFLAHWSIFAVVSTGILCVSPTIATCLCPLGQSGVPFSLVLFASLVLFFHNVSFLSLSSMPSCLLIYIYCIFHGHSMCVFHYSHVFVPCRAIWSSLLSCPLPFSRPFLSECFFPFPFFHAFLSLDLYLL